MALCWLRSMSPYGVKLTDTCLLLVVSVLRPASYVLPFINSLRPGEAYMRFQIWWSLVKVSCLTPCQCIRQCCIIDNWTPRNNVFHPRNRFANVVSKIMAIFSRPQWVKRAVDVLAIYMNIQLIYRKDSINAAVNKIRTDRASSCHQKPRNWLCMWRR